MGQRGEALQNFRAQDPIGVINICISYLGVIDLLTGHHSGRTVPIAFLVILAQKLLCCPLGCRGWSGEEDAHGNRSTQTAEPEMTSTVRSTLHKRPAVDGWHPHPHYQLPLS